MTLNQLKELEQTFNNSNTDILEGLLCVIY